MGREVITARGILGLLVLNLLFLFNREREVWNRRFQYNPEKFLQHRARSLRAFHLDVDVPTGERNTAGVEGL